MNSKSPIEVIHCESTNLVCQDCGASIVDATDMARWFRRCEPCSAIWNGIAAKAKEKHDTEEAARATAILNEAWESVCPFEYRMTNEGGKTDLALLNAAKIQTNEMKFVRYEALKFSDKPGIWLTGDAGAMKTRIAWRLCRSQFTETDSVMAFTHWSFQADLLRKLSSHETASWMDKMTEAKVVFFDDLGKAEFSPSGAAAFFELIERRSSHGRKMVFTSNHSRADMGTLMGESSGLASRSSVDGAVRRLMEYFDAYLVSKP